MRQHIEHVPPVQVAPGVFHMSTTHEVIDDLVSEERMMFDVFALGLVLGIVVGMVLT